MRRVLSALGLLAVTASGAHAQYFGRNQVQYESFDFRIMRTEHFDIYFYPTEREATEYAARMAERWHARLTSVMGHELRGRQPLILYAAHAHFQQTNAIGGGVGEGTGGVTESFKRRIVLPFTVSMAETDHVIGHELVHAFQYDMTGRGRSQAPGAAALPLWFIEGMAEYLSIGPLDAETSMWLRDAAAHDKLPKVNELNNPRYFPYRYGHAFWAYVGGRWGDEAVGRVLRSAGRNGDPISAIQVTLAIDVDSLSSQWHQAIRSQWEALRVATQPVSELGQPMLTEETTNGKLNVGPSLSPDGSRVAFLSERDLFSIELFLADAETGRIHRKITSTALDGHLESIQFINSAGAWNSDNRRFVLSAQVQGQAALVIMDMNNGDREREIKIEQVDDIQNPSWSPDGEKIVFSGQAGGLTDLYVYDLANNQLRRLMSDAFADLQPVWSPEGSRIAFVTDRFGTNLNRLRYGEYRLAWLDVASGTVTQAPGFPMGKHINPQWAAGGRLLYFLAEPDGVTNVYRLDVASGQITRVSNLFTGITGISTLSPALSAAANADRIAITIQNDNEHEVYRIDGAAALAGEPVSSSERYMVAATLPPQAGARLPSHIAAYLEDESAGLPPADSFRVDRYRPSFGLDYIAQPSLAVGVDRFGTYVGGGAALFWSSMLGDRQLATALQVQGGIRDIAAQVSYINLKNRIDWAFSVGQQPYMTGFYDEVLVNGPGGQEIQQREVIYRQLNQQVGLQFAYPFSRVRRMELAVGARRISFSQRIRGNRFDAAPPNNYLGPIDVDTSVGDPITLGEGTLATVFDNSIFGGTGPVVGGRYRFEASPTIGSLNFLSALADVRKYWMPVRPVTFATRLMHFGRYGGGSNDSLLSPLFLGYQSLMRGYDNGSFSFDECVPDATSFCPSFDQLLGSRLIVGNAELRVPLMGGLGLITRNFLPIDLAIFGDAGVAWSNATGNDKPEFAGGTRKIVTSYGAGLRINLFGYFIAEIDMVHPNDRPGKGWYLQLGLNPGF